MRVRGLLGLLPQGKVLEWRLVAAGHNIRKLFLAECEKGKMAAGAMA